jgi:hypothetical protein
VRTEAKGETENHTHREGKIEKKRAGVREEKGGKDWGAGAGNSIHI